MIGGKPVTVQMAGGGNKTFTLVGNQLQQGVSPVGKIVRLPSTSTVVSATGNSSDQPKLMVVQRTKQPSATIGELNKNLFLIR